MIPKRGEKGRSEMRFRYKKHQKRLSKTRDMQIKNLDRITELILWKLNKETKKCERKNKIGATNNDV